VKRIAADFKRLALLASLRNPKCKKVNNRVEKLAQPPTSGLEIKQCLPGKLPVYVL
jgi:hypothetical protein